MSLLKLFTIRRAVRLKLFISLSLGAHWVHPIYGPIISFIGSQAWLWVEIQEARNDVQVV